LVAAERPGNNYIIFFICLTKIKNLFNDDSLLIVYFLFN
jgi:hypothetical protein